MIVRRGGSEGNGSSAEFDLDFERPRSIGRLRGFQGNYGCFVRAYAYICSLGAAGLRDASETAVLNANYLLARLRALGVTELLPPAYDRLCMHEFVLSGAPMARELGIRTLDLAKRLLDHGYHPPTVYFPLLVEEAMLIEPTETETRETLDAFAAGDRRDPARGARGPRDRARRAVHDARAPPRRGRRGPPPGAAPAARRRGALASAPMRIFSGIQPTGRKHLGNYIGAITQYVAGQDRGDAVYCIVDLHAITVAFDPAELRERTYDTAAILLAAGLDPARCILFRQSDVVEHSELAWLLGAVTAYGDLARMTQFKEKAPQAARARLRRAVLLPGAAGRRRARLPHRRGAGRRRPAPAHRADARHRDALQRTASARSSSCPSIASRRSARGSWTSRIPTARCRRPTPARREPCYVLDEPERDRAQVPPRRHRLRLGRAPQPARRRGSRT